MKTKTAYVPKAHKVSLKKKFMNAIAVSFNADAAYIKKGVVYLLFVDIDYFDDCITGSSKEVSLSLWNAIKNLYNYKYSSK